MVNFLLIGILLVAPSYASVCNQLTNCNDCNSVFARDGSQTCSWCVDSGNCVSRLGLECVFGNRISQKSQCPLKIRGGFEYDETFARNIMLSLSSAAYSDDPQLCLTNALHQAKLIRQVTVRCDPAKSDLCSGFTAISEYHRAVMISFRGTSSGVMQLFFEGAEAIFSKQQPVTGGGKASKYFFDAFYAIWNNGMSDDVRKMKSSFPDYELWITGHSLGGSMAAIAANVAVASGMYVGEKVKVVTFGEPRTGNQDFAAAHDSLLPYTYRVTHAQDLVPHLPTEDFEGYHHHRYEVWYDNNMKPGASHVLCLTPEDNECSDSNFVDVSVEDHLHYFGRDVSGNGYDGCPGVGR